MAQHDYVIANGTGAAVRSDLNNALAAIVSQNSGATEPTTTYAYMPWADTGSSPPVFKIRNAANNGWITLYQLDGEWSTIALENGTAGAPSIYFKDSGTDTGIYSPGTDQVAISTGGTGRLFVDASGRVLIGTSTARTVQPYGLATNGYAGLTFEGVGDSTPQTVLTICSNNNTEAPVGAGLYLARTRGSAVGSTTIVNSGDNLGTISFAGADGNDLRSRGAAIYAEVDGTPGADDMPGRIVLSTTADGASSPTERMRIDSSGRVGIGTTTPIRKFVASKSGAEGVEIEPGEGANENYEVHYNRSGAVYCGKRTIASFHRFENGSGEIGRWDTSGRFLVGTSTAFGSNDELLHIASPSAGSIALLRDDTSIGSGNELGGIRWYSNATTSSTYQVCAQIRAVAEGTFADGDKPSRLEFSVTRDGQASPTEALRIKNTGSHSTFSSVDVFIARSGAAASTGNVFFYGVYSGTGVDAGGTISYAVFTNGDVQNTNNSYGAYSDIKLKENIVDAGSQWNDLKALRVRKYNLKEGQTHTQIGLVAQEVEPISPGLVYESPDRDEEGNDLGTVTKSVNYSVLYMKAVKALQEAMERIEQLESEMAAVKAQLS